MKARDIVLYIITRCQDRPEFGRTSLQKVAYFVGRAMDRDLGHRAYYYGPFASSVERETETLVLSNLVEERVQPLGFSGASGFAAKQYEYKLTELGRDRIKELESKHPSEIGVIDEVVDTLIQHAGTLDQRLLAAAAKVDYIARQESRPGSIDDVRLAAHDLGWSLTESQVGEVIDLLGRFGFARTVT